MKWIWQSPAWPQFEFENSDFDAYEQQFKIESAKLLGATSMITADQQQSFLIELMSEEALRTSIIEGEVLDRDSVASSLLRQFGFKPEQSDYRVTGKEKGMAALMVDNYQNYGTDLTHEMLWLWHPCVVTPSLLVQQVGAYRNSKETMRIVSGFEGREKVHYEAPPSDRVRAEMDAYIQWFNDTAPGGSDPLPAIVRASIAHLYFEAIHPFEDGNGRIGRALSEKVLAQSMDRPGLFSLSHVIARQRSEYYRQLEITQAGMNIALWLHYFSQVILDAVVHSQRLSLFIVEKARLFDRVRDQINERQQKVLLRMFASGMDGFTGGMSAGKYMKMTGSISKTASRDLQALVDMGALLRTGKLKGTRYWLNLGEPFDGPRLEHLELTEGSKGENR